MYFGALAKVHGRGHPRERVLVLAVRPDAPQAWERFGCQTIDSILLPDTRQPAPFVGAQKGRKSAISAWLLTANEIAGDFDAAVQLV